MTAPRHLCFLQALVPLADEGFTGYFGSQMPMLTQAGVESTWPPAFDSEAPVRHCQAKRHFAYRQTLVRPNSDHEKRTRSCSRWTEHRLRH